MAFFNAVTGKRPNICLSLYPQNIYKLRIFKLDNNTEGL